MTSQPLRIVFAGTPEFASIHLKALLETNHEIVGVYTQPDRRSGRGKKLTASPVKQCALDAGIHVFQPSSLKKDVDAQAELAQLKPDVIVVVAYGLILPQEVLDIPSICCLNVHGSLLPRWRGAAPIQRAIEAGDSRTGVTIMQMDAGLDTGNMLAKASCDITEETTAASLHDTLAELGAPLLLDVLNDLKTALAQGQVQSDEHATYADKINKPEALINWSLDAKTIEQRIRAFNPFPVCFSELNGERVKIWQATASQQRSDSCPGTVTASDPTGISIACGAGTLIVSHLQLPGGKALSAAQILNARREVFAPGVSFTQPAEAN
ncbi:MAG: methionyl-tRNA formyltransferase [Halioglobus sp.]